MILPLVAALMGALPAMAAPSADTMSVCKALYAKYPTKFAWDPLGANALQTAANASLYSTTDHDYWVRLRRGQAAATPN